MSRFLLLLGRFFVVVVGYGAASLAASLFMNIVLAGSGGLEASETDMLYRTGLLTSIAVGTLFVGYFAFLPAMVAIVIGEIAGKRDWLFYALGGAAVGAIVVTLFWTGGDQNEIDPAFALMIIASGITGAWVYWIIAGRNAGSWQVRRRDEVVTSTPPEES